MWQNIWSFKTKNFRVDYDVAPDNDLDLSWDDDGQTREGLDNGTYIAFVARVSVWHHGMEVGSDILGGCIYEDTEAFMDHRGSKGEYGSYFSDMVREACQQARKTLHNVPRLRV